MNSYNFLLVLVLAKGEKVEFAKIFLRLLYARLDKCVGNVPRGWVTMTWCRMWIPISCKCSCERASGILRPSQLSTQTECLVKLRIVNWRD